MCIRDSLWGPPQSGKTTYLAALKLTIDTFKTGWRMAPRPGDDAAEQFLEKETAALSQGIMPAATESQEPIAYTFQMEHQATSVLGLDGRYQEITIFDAAGRVVLRATFSPAYFAQLASCLGILLMIDPGINREAGQPGPDGNDIYYEMFMRLYHQLRRPEPDKGMSVDRSLALCVTKIDEDDVWHAYAGKYREDSESFMRYLVGDAAYNYVYNHFTRVKCFAVSAVGRYGEGEDRKKNFVCDENGVWRIADLRQWQPYHVLDPIMWLFDEIEARQQQSLPAWRRLAQSKLREPNYPPPELFRKG